jgi:DNA-binding transcriptional ArsR family regulator
VGLVYVTAGFDRGQPTVSHHLAKLRNIGLVSSVVRPSTTAAGRLPRRDG